MSTPITNTLRNPLNDVQFTVSADWLRNFCYRVAAGEHEVKHTKLKAFYKTFGESLYENMTPETTCEALREAFCDVDGSQISSANLLVNNLLQILRMLQMPIHQVEHVLNIDTGIRVTIRDHLHYDLAFDILYKTRPSSFNISFLDARHEIEIYLAGIEYGFKKGF